MSAETLNLTPALYAYFQSVSLREPAVLKKLREETRQLKSYAMQISPEQGQFMAWLMEVLEAKKTLDIGTFTGYSALVVALALPEYGRVVTCDMDEKSTVMAKRFWDMSTAAHKIDLRLAPALETLQKLLESGEEDTFDFVFIDADKTNYKAYYEQSLVLLRKGGVIAIDNVLWEGKVADKDVNDKSTVAIRELNDFICRDERVTLSMLPIGDGLTLARKR